ncbi:MAG: MBL fold metallo-hydrolase, partial [Candidatus Abyssubacteria bacterium]|nr:MBL fold metallo-hydrolase [Candidatus Abyssubacteria bacterium]
PTPFYVGPINAYLIEDEPLTLVDSGVKTDEAEEALRTGLAELGLAFGDIEQLVITHSHLEHYGLMASVASEGRPRVFAHPLEIYDLQSERGYASPDDKRNERVEKFLLESGMPEEKLGLILTRHPIFERLRDHVRVTHPVEDGDKLKFRHMELTVIHCPGHSPGMINLYDPEAKVLLSGDNILKHISPVPLLSFPQDPKEPREHSLAAYLATLRRLKKYDIDLTLTGHGEIIYDLKEIIDSITLHHEARKRKALKFLADGPKTAYDVCGHLFPKLEPLHLFLAMSEAVGHLDILEMEGAVEIEKKEGITYHVSKADSKR